MEQLAVTRTKKSTKDIIFNILRQKTYLKLYKKYSSNNFSYNTICINNIVYNEACLIVAKFKDYLIYDDNTEFLRKFYNSLETKFKLYRILELYENYSKIFPNYLVIKEKKFMYKNIRRKQKMIDAFNQIKLEEEENRKKIKEQNDENKEENILFTDFVKNEIKTFQKDNNKKPYTNSFDSQKEKDESDTLFGRSHSHSSININLLNKKDLNKGLSFDSKANENETNGTISGILNIMNDSKIYIKDLPNIFKVNRNKDYIIEKKEITFKKKNNIDKWPKLNDNKSTNNIKNNNTNINFQKIILTPQKDEKEIYFSKKLFHFNSTILSKKRIKMLNPSLISSNSNPNSIKKENNNFPQKQNIYLPSSGNTIININNNFYQEVAKTERLEPSKLKKRINVNEHNYKTLQNSSREKESKNHKNDINLNIKNSNLLMSNYRKCTNKNFNYIKCKHISHDFSYKKNTTTEFNNKTTNKIYNNFIINNEKRELSPQFVLGVRKKLKTIIKFKDSKNNNSKITNNAKAIINNYNIKNEIINYYTQKSKSKSKSKEKNKNKTNKEKKDIISKDKIKNNKRQIINHLKNNRLNYNEYSSLSFINTAKTESNIITNNLSKNTKTQKMEKFKEKQKTCFNFVKNKISKINKDMLLQDKFFITNYKNENKTEKKVKNINKNIDDLITKNKKTNKLYKSKDISKSIKINNKSIKNKILKSEVKMPSKQIIYNYNHKNNYNPGQKMNTFIEYTTICGKNLNKESSINSKSIEKRKKCESIDFSSREHYYNKNIFKNIFKKIESVKRNSYIYSPRSSLSNFLNTKNTKIINDYFPERQFIVTQSIFPSHNTCNISKNDIRSKYKAILLTKNNKKSYDFNSDIRKKYKQNILNATNYLKKNFYSSIFRKKPESNSIDLNTISYSNKYSSNTYRNQSKDKDKENENKDLFKKIMSFKMNKNKNKKEDKFAKSNNKIKEMKSINLPLTTMTIKVNTSNFLSRIKSKNKNKKCITMNTMSTNEYLSKK
jgi:hypothetical protein